MIRKSYPACTVLFAATFGWGLTTTGCSDGNDEGSGGSTSSGGATIGGSTSTDGGSNSGGLSGSGGETNTGGQGAGDGGADPGTGGEAMGSGGAEDVDYPTDTSQTGIEAFLEAESYKSAPWVGDPEIRSSDTPGNIHGEFLKTYFNTRAIESVAVADEHSITGAMVVKEIFDDAGTMIGRATQLKTGEGDTKGDWTYYCAGPEGSLLCTNDDSTLPAYGVGIDGCGFCHGQEFYAPPPE